MTLEDFLTPHPFLDRFDPNERSAVSNDFLYTIRRMGPSTPQAVCSAVWKETKATRWRERSKKLLSVLAEDPEGALDYAARQLAWEALPPSDKQAVKSMKQQAGIAAWQMTQAPTEKQLAYLEGLGYTGEVRHRRHASELIDQLVNGEAS